MSPVDVRAWFLTSQERENPHTRIDDVRGDGTAWSSGNTVRAIVHGRPYFEELHERITGLGPGDRLYFADWRGDPDEQLTDDPGSTLNATLVAAAERGVDVRGLLWRSHWHRLGFSAHRHRYLGEEIGEAGGQCLRDMRVRNRGAHHQKFVVIRYAEDPTRDIAYVGGIDLCHGRRDDHDHDGDPQAVELAKAYGPTPAWHDVQVAIQGPAVHDVETTFRERWEDSTPLTAQPRAPGLELGAPRRTSPRNRWAPSHRLPRRGPKGTTSSRSSGPSRSSCPRDSTSHPRASAR